MPSFFGSGSGSDPRLARVWLASGLVTALGAGAVVASVLAMTPATLPAPAPAPPTPAQLCAPAIDMKVLPARDRSYIARQVMTCSDHVLGKISDDAYRARIAKLDAAWDATPPDTEAVVAAAPAVQWAATVRGVSSQYTNTSWSAENVLGAPDVFPASGDNAHAWASLGADTGPEWIEVGYANPTPISAIDIVETYNPGAVHRVLLRTASGEQIVAYAGAAGTAGGAARMQKIAIACTAEPIVAVRVELDSQAVPGWNELDAIGVEPCAEQ
jgi:hypothetical protein